MRERRPPNTAPAAASDSPETGTDATLDDLRLRIDEVDRALLEQLNARARLVQEVGRLKDTTGAALYAPAREREIVQRLAAGNPGPFPNRALPHVFREIISATRSLEGAVRVAFLGPEGTFCHQAARGQFGAQAEFEPMTTIPEVIAAVERGAVDFGVVPVENTTEGVVTETLDTFAESDVLICGELLLRISENLLSRSGRREDIRQVVSHPQPLAQCRRWLDRHLPGVDRLEMPSTSAAARRAAEDGSVAAIASALAAEIYGLETVEASIEDRRDNATRFLVIGARSAAPTGQDLTSAVFTVRKDQSGALHRLLEPFARHGVNLTSIQSRPIKGKPWEYLFFVDMEGHQDEEAVALALKDAADCAFSYRVLGSFPRASERPEVAP